MDRSVYQLPFRRDNVPAWKCPVCMIGNLTLDDASLDSRETAASLRSHAHDAWEPDWTRGVFVCLFVCNHPSCASPIACSGSSKVDYFEYEDEEFGIGQLMEQSFTPLNFQPPLMLMDIPGKCPEPIKECLYTSFALFFANPGAALNAIRAALEILLTDRGIKRSTIVRNKRKLLNLHQRIAELPAKYQEVRDLILAVKWLGNAGSHAGSETNAGDVRVAYDMFEHVLAEIYEEKTKKLKAAARSVNKRKGV